MKKISGFIFALFVLLAGATLVPAMGLPSQGFSWELSRMLTKPSEYSCL